MTGICCSAIIIALWFRVRVRVMVGVRVRVTIRLSIILGLLEG